VKSFMSAVALVCIASVAKAQVGHLPEKSPYRDLEARQEISLFGGHYDAANDPAGIAPQGGPMWGARYQVHVGGPAFLTARFAHVTSKRDAIDPTKLEATRSLGTHNVSLDLFDANLAINLTGEKTYHRIVPVLNMGAGIATCACSVDKDPYTFGTPFAFSYGGGLRYAPGGRFQITADWNYYLYQLKYPTEYYVVPAGGTAAVSGTQPRSFWKTNRALTIGASLLFFR